MSEEGFLKTELGPAKVLLNNYCAHEMLYLQYQMDSSRLFSVCVMSFYPWRVLDPAYEEECRVITDSVSLFSGLILAFLCLLCCTGFSNLLRHKCTSKFLSDLWLEIRKEFKKI